MQYTKMMITGALAVLTIAPGVAHADGNFYLGGSVGSASLDEQFDGFDVNTDSTAFRLVAGWQFNDYFSLEGGYHSFGKFEQRFPNDGTPLNISLRADGFTLGATGTIPLADRLALYGRVGSFFWDGNAEINNMTQARPEDTNLFFGAGVKYALTESLSLVADWSDYQLEDTSSDVLSLGLTFSF